MIKFLLAAVTIAGASAANCEVTALGNGIAAGTCTAGKAVGQTLASEGTCAFAAKAGYATTGAGVLLCNAAGDTMTTPSTLAVTGCLANFYQSAGNSAANGVCLACAGSTKLAAAAFGGSPTTCVVASSDATCAAIDAAKPKWLASAGGGSCVACIASGGRNDIGHAGCTDDGSGFGKAKVICSKTTPNTCVPHAENDASCAVIDTAFPIFMSETMSCITCVRNVLENGDAASADDGTSKGCTDTEYCTDTPPTCAAKGVDDTTCAAIKLQGVAAKPKWSTVSKKCVAAATNDATCPTIDAAKLKFRQAACLACLVSGDCTGNGGTDVCSTATPNTCVAKGADDTTCTAIDAAKPKWSTVSKECVAAATGDATCVAIDAAKSKWLGCVDGSTANKNETTSSPVTCGDGTALTANKCEIVSPTDVELAKMCGEGTTYDKEKKKCATDPTSRCTPGLTNTTIDAADNSANAVESAGSSHFASRTATLAATVIVVLFCKL